MGDEGLCPRRGEEGRGVERWTFVETREICCNVAEPETCARRCKQSASLIRGFRTVLLCETPNKAYVPIPSESERYVRRRVRTEPAQGVRLGAPVTAPSLCRAGNAIKSARVVVIWSRIDCVGSVKAVRGGVLIC